MIQCVYKSLFLICDANVLFVDGYLVDAEELFGDDPYELKKEQEAEETIGFDIMYSSLL